LGSKYESIHRALTEPADIFKWLGQMSSNVYSEDKGFRTFEGYVNGKTIKLVRN